MPHRVEACGVCHSDFRDGGGDLGRRVARVPGHEVVGRIDLVGEGVEGWGVNASAGRLPRRQRAGIGEYCETAIL